MSVSEQGSASRKESASEKFLRNFSGKPQDFYSSLGAQRHEGNIHNGLQVVLFKKSGEKAKIYFATAGAARQDEGELAGRAHFNEHLLLAGTKKYPRKDNLVRPIEKEGGSIGAATANEYMGIHAYVGKSSEFPFVLQTVSECVQESQYHPDTVENERGSVLQEIGRKEASPANQLYPEYQKAFFAKTPLEIPILGTKSTVLNMQKEQLMQHTQEMLVSNRTTLLISGNMKIENVLEDADKLFGSLEKGQKIEPSKTLPETENQVVIKKYADTDLVYFHVGFRTEPASFPDSGTLRLIASVLGEGRTSLLNQKLRYEKDTGWIYGVDAASWQFSDAGSFGIYGSTTKEHLQKVFDKSFTLIEDIRQDGLSDDDIEFVKNKKIINTLNGFGAVSPWVDNHLSSEVNALHPHPALSEDSLKFPVYESVYQMAKVTSSDVKRVAEKYFKPGKWHLAMCGDVSERDIKIDF